MAEPVIKPAVTLSMLLRNSVDTHYQLPVPANPEFYGAFELADIAWNLCKAKKYLLKDCVGIQDD